MEYLVTGAAGFIGAAIAGKLMQQGVIITTIDNLSTGRRENIPDGCHFVQGNTFDPDVLGKLHHRHFDAIIHIAGQSSGEVSFENPVYDLQTNTQSTLMLLQYAVETGCKKFIYASSMSVYGDADPALVDENTWPVPKSFYAVGKLASENYMRIYSQYGMDCTALRFFNVYGTGQNMENLKQGMASIFLAQALRDHHILVKGSKDRFRDFVYIDDVVNAVQMALEKAHGFNVYNVCTKKYKTVETVVQTIQSLLPYDVTVAYSAGTPGDQHGIYGDFAKIERDLGWRPETSFYDGMKKMVAWAQNEPHRGGKIAGNTFTGKQKVYALLTGRGNNTLKDKNVLDCLGHPVLYYPANAARNAQTVSKLFCSSDDEKILQEAKKAGHRSIRRPAEMAAPNSQHVDCILHALGIMQAENDLPDILVVTLANNVTIKSEWIDACVRRMQADLTLTAVVPVYKDNDHHPLRAKTVDASQHLQMYEKGITGKVSTNRQELPPCYFLSHNFWVLNVEHLLQDPYGGQQPWAFMGDRIAYYEIEESIDIHKEIDLYVAREWIKMNYTDFDTTGGGTINST